MFVDGDHVLPLMVDKKLAPELIPCARKKIDDDYRYQRYGYKIIKKDDKYN